MNRRVRGASRGSPPRLIHNSGFPIRGGLRMRGQSRHAVARYRGRHFPRGVAHKGMGTDKPSPSTPPRITFLHPVFFGGRGRPPSKKAMSVAVCSRTRRTAARLQHRRQPHSTWRANGLLFEAGSAKYGPRPPKMKERLPQRRASLSLFLELGVARGFEFWVLSWKRSSQDIGNT